MKRHKGRVSHVPREELKVEGDYAIVSESEGRMTVKQIETAILTLKRTLPKGTVIKSRLQGHIAVSEKPLEVRMGKGKGAIGKRVARVRINTVMFEIEGREGAPEGKYIMGMRVVGMKLPVRSRIIKGRKTEEKVGEGRAADFFILTSKKVNEENSDRPFNPEVGNKYRKTNSRFSRSDKQNEESEG